MSQLRHESAGGKSNKLLVASPGLNNRKPALVSFFLTCTVVCYTSQHKDNCYVLIYMILLCMCACAHTYTLYKDRESETERKRERVLLQGSQMATSVYVKSYRNSPMYVHASAY